MPPVPAQRSMDAGTASQLIPVFDRPLVEARQDRGIGRELPRSAPQSVRDRIVRLEAQATQTPAEQAPTARWLAGYACLWDRHARIDGQDETIRRGAFDLRGGVAVTVNHERVLGYAGNGTSMRNAFVAATEEGLFFAVSCDTPLARATARLVAEGHGRGASVTFNRVDGGVRCSASRARSSPRTSRKWPS